MKRFLTDEQEKLVTEAIQKAEKETSGEIRVHIQPRCGDDPYKAARKIFEKLGMTATEQRNGVLFFIAHKTRKFAVLGDKGIDEAVPDDFWDETVSLMTPLFSEAKFAEGISAGITNAGKALQKFFPYRKDDVNELSNDINYG